MTTPTPADRRPNRAMHATGPEITVTGTPLGTDRPVRHVLRQVGWLGQTGAFYDLDENPRPTEPGSYAPLYFMAHSDYVADPESTEIDRERRYSRGLRDTLRRIGALNPITHEAVMQIIRDGIPEANALALEARRAHDAGDGAS